jgi:hypothetical protein
MATALPVVPSIPSYNFSSTLEVYDDSGETVPAVFLFDVYWNTRAGSWFMHVFEADGTPIRHGIRIVLGTILGGRSVDRRFPAGALKAEDLSGKGIEATLDDLGTRVVIYYYTDDEL